MLGNLLKLIGSVDNPAASLSGLLRLAGDSGLREKFKEAVDRVRNDPAIKAEVEKLLADVVADLFPAANPPST